MGTTVALERKMGKGLVEVLHCIVRDPLFKDPSREPYKKFSVIAQGLWNGSVLLLAVYCAGMALKGIVLWLEVVSV